MYQNENKRGGLFSFLSLLILAAMFTVGVFMIYKVVQSEQAVCKHQWNDGVIIQEATCTDYGVEKFTCTKCWFEKTSEISPMHTFFDLETSKKVTCIDNGYEPKKECRDCGYIKASEILPALGHEWIITKEKAATCTENGNTYGKECSRCGYAEAVCGIIQALGHDNEIFYHKEATCIEAGYSTYTHCNTCGEDSEHEIYPATGHSYKDCYRAATCMTGGEEGKECYLCGDSTVTKIAPLWHDFRDTGTCSRCYESITIENLNYIQSVSLQGNGNGRESLVYSCGEVPSSVEYASGTLGMVFVERSSLDKVAGRKNDNTDWVGILGNQSYLFSEMEIDDNRNGQAILEGITFEKLNVEYVAIPCIQTDLREESGEVYYQYAYGVATGYAMHSYSVSEVAFRELHKATVEQYENGKETLTAERLSYLQEVTGAAIDRANGKKAPEKTTSRLQVKNIFKNYVVRYKASNNATFIDFDIIPQQLEGVVPVTIIVNGESAENDKLEVLYEPNTVTGNVTRYRLKDLNNGTSDEGIKVMVYIGAERFEITVFIKDY